MKILISPAKKMRTDTDTLSPQALPAFLPETERLLSALRSLSRQELKQLWRCSDAITDLNVERLARMELGKGLTPALLSYQGIQYQYMAPGVFETGQFTYLQEHLRILSAFYGIVRPFDSIQPYRLEMQCKLKVQDYNDLYAYWQDTLAKVLLKEVHTHKENYLLNLSSKEYEKAIRPYIPKEQWIDVIFQVEKKGKRKVEATQAKMARGRMVHFLAQRQVETLAEVYQFQEDGYQLDKERTGNQQIVFYKKG